MKKTITTTFFAICLLLIGFNRAKAQTCFNTVHNKSVIAGSPNPVSAAFGNFNGNNMADFIVAGASSNGISVLLDYDGNYSYASVITVNTPTANGSITDLEVADFDQDGNADIIAVNNTLGKISIIPGLGNGTFTTTIDYSILPHAQAVAIADFNADNLPDMALVSSNAPYTMMILKNTTSAGSPPTFSTTATFTTNVNQSQDIEALDFNVDGYMDIVVSNYGNNTISLYQNNGTGAFTYINSFATGNSPLKMTSGNFNTDGKQDIAVINSASNNVIVYINSSVGIVSFDTTYYSVGTQPQAITSGDYNADGIIDLAITENGGSSNVYMLPGIGGGNFGAATIIATLGSSVYPAKIISGDYNLDGNIDLGVTQEGNNSFGIILNARPIITGPSSLCVGTASTFTATGGATTYSWTSPSASGYYATVTPSSTGIYTLSVIGSVGSCSLTATSTVTVNALPTITVSGGAICPGQNFTITPGGAATYTYTSGSSVVTPTTATNYTVNGTDINGCINSATLSVYVNLLPQANPVSVSICETQTLQIDASPSFPSPNNNYAWAGPGGATSNSFNISIPNALPINTGIYTVTVTDNGQNGGCVNTATVNAFVNALPTVTVNSGTICTGNSFTMTPGGAGSYNYSNGNSVSTPTASTSYTVTGVDANGCTNNAISNVTVNSLPTISVNSPSICYGSGATLTGGGANTYTWSTSVVSPSITINPTANSSFTVNGTDANGCTNSAVANVTVVNNDDISGTIYDTTTVSGLHPIIHGSVYLYTQQNASTAIDTTGLLASGVSVQIQANGSYSFSQVVGGNYYIKAEADTHFYHGSVATYLSTRLNKAYRWDSATVISHATCGNGIDAGHDISIIELPGLTGTGIISGTITAAPSFGGRYASGGHSQIYGSPLKGIDVKLGKSPGGGCSARTRADTSGAYTFTGVDTGAYSIYVDIPNYGMITILTTTISPTNTQSLNNNYCVDSVAINVCSGALGIKQNANNSYNVSIYPNPNNGIFNLQVAEHENMSVEVYSVIGQKVYAETLQNNLQSLNISTLNDGVYFVRVLKNNSVVYQTKICKQ